ncbi:MAG: alpha-1,4-glucan--maltose-1-phosphate maltosyltransferase [Verrucomicrobiales bacterium]|nr:alpha-1,4-glucan--maltose-1-phosphate maltosyltransferase [Verrucomicrobiales bacterium]|tara:strand:- start:3793 stop:5760 length:1968 start_codon:yes stop_codon:yes gene_type:complete
MASLKNRPASVVISNLSPLVEDGRYPTKRVIDEASHVSADIFKDGHDVLCANLLWRKSGKKKWQSVPMTHYENDRWGASLSFDEIGLYEIKVVAWADDFLSWVHDFERRLTGDQEDFSTEIEEGRVILGGAALRAARGKSVNDAEAIEDLTTQLMKADPSNVMSLLNPQEVVEILARWPNLELATTSTDTINVVVETKLSSFCAWYEFFPRSAEGIKGKHSTFRDCLPRIEDAKAMGFDIIYFPPIHPIGISHRKGKNNSVTCEPSDVGSPWAIGAKEGGHRSVEPQLGTIDDFVWLLKRARKMGMEIALDFAINCSPDHPYVAEHPEWFYRRPDGSIKYAENPPKKYQDIYPLDFHCDDWRELWKELCDVVRFWVGKGVRIFRVDNPHTKPVAFWEWLIAEIHETNPDVIFLSEAFTKPKMMQTLAKIGFTQSYTYFTWRESRNDLIEYVTELTKGDMREYYRANFWPNTPDILPRHLQNAGPAAFKIRAALASLLSSCWGIYSGYELCENTPLSGSEDYLDSEKYQLKTRDWNTPGNIKAFISRLNLARREIPALQSYANIEFIPADNDQMIAFHKWSEDGASRVIVVINLDPKKRQETNLHLPLEQLGLKKDTEYTVEDVIYGEAYTWRDSTNFVALDPRTKPVHILNLRKS